MSRDVDAVGGSSRPTAVDLFAGAGGLALGFEQAGCDILAAVEYDPVHAAVHSFNFPLTTTLCADISQVSADDIRSAVEHGWRSHDRPGKFSGTVDVLFGGPPCQGFSMIGKRLVDDARNQLVFHFFRLVTELQPRYFVMENVPGMAVGLHSGILRNLIDEFADAGYHITLPAKILNAADFGVPQHRKRLFLLGARDGELPAEYPASTTRAASRRRQAATSAEPLLPWEDGPASGPTVWDAIGDLPDLDQFTELLATDEVALSDEHLRRMDKVASPYARLLRDGRLDRKDLSYPRRWNPSVLTGSMRTVHTERSIERFAGTAPGETEPISRFLRLAPDGLCNTLRAGTGGERGAYTSPRPIHPKAPRVISVREAARLHSFPDWFRLHQTKWHGFRQVGNAVPPLLGRAVANQIAKAMGATPAKPEREICLGNPHLLTLAMREAAEDLGAETAQMPRARTRQNGDKAVSRPRRSEGTRYAQILEHIFANGYEPGVDTVEFTRDDIVRAAAELGIDLPKNLGDVIYSFRYRVPLPESIRERAPAGKHWIIRPVGRARYMFAAVDPGTATITPSGILAETKVPDATPGIIAQYALNDEQALLAILRYNRLIDIFTGVTCYSLQSHLRTTVPEIGQVETDEVYVGLDRRGAHYVFPVQAKGGRDTINVVQIEQDFAIGNSKFPKAICRPIAAQFMDDSLIALFEFEQNGAGVAVSNERHYRLVPVDEISDHDLRTYAERTD